MNNQNINYKSTLHEPPKKNILLEENNRINKNPIPKLTKYPNFSTIINLDSLTNKFQKNSKKKKEKKALNIEIEKEPESKAD